MDSDVLILPYYLTRKSFSASALESSSRHLPTGAAILTRIVSAPGDDFIAESAGETGQAGAEEVVGLGVVWNARASILTGIRVARRKPVLTEATGVGRRAVAGEATSVVGWESGGWGGLGEMEGGGSMKVGYWLTLKHRFGWHASLSCPVFKTNPC